MTVALEPGTPRAGGSGGAGARPTAAHHAEHELRTRSRLFVVTALAQFATFGFGFFSSAAVSRGLTTADRGVLALVITIVTHAQIIGHFSVEQSQTYEWANGVRREVLATNAVVIGLLNGVLAASVAWIAVRVIAPGSFGAVSRSTLLVGLASVPLIIMTLYLAQLTRLDDRLDWLNRIRVGVTGLYTCYVGALYVTDRLTVHRAVVGWAVSSFAPGLLALRGFEIRARHFSAPVAWRTVTKGLAYHPAMAAIFLLWRIDQLLINAHYGRNTVPIGLYAQAATVSEMALVLTTSIAQVMLPKQVEGSIADATRFSATIVRVNLVFSAVVAAGLALFGPWAITVVYGSQYRGSGAPLIALLPGIVAMAALAPCQAVMVRLNRPWFIAIVYFSGLVLNVVLNLLLLPRWGITGTALASTVPYIVLTMIVVKWISHETRHPVREFLPGRADLRLLLKAVPPRLRPARLR